MFIIIIKNDNSNPVYSIQSFESFNRIIFPCSVIMTLDKTKMFLSVFSSQDATKQNCQEN